MSMPCLDESSAPELGTTAQVRKIGSGVMFPSLSSLSPKMDSVGNALPVNSFFPLFSVSSLNATSRIRHKISFLVPFFFTSPVRRNINFRIHKTCMQIFLSFYEILIFKPVKFTP